MSSPKFTPGPWSDVATARSPSGHWHEIKSGDVVIAEVFDDNTNDGTYPDPQTQAANARLIAIAPELLGLAWQYESDLRHPPSGDSLQRRLERIRAVLAKFEAVDA